MPNNVLTNTWPRHRCNDAPMDLSTQPWRQPELTQIGRLPMRAPLGAFRDAASVAEDPARSPWRRSLDGAWRFRLIDRPTDAPQRWTQSGYSDANWREIDVPGCWTRQATADLPHYTNIIMPWPEDPPFVPDDNPTGLYRREFSTPAGWKGRRVVLHLGGAESMVLVWCNGEFVGLSTDSRLPAEFDLTPMLNTTAKAGPNQLAVMVVRWCAATWIEDQDHWWHAGLHRGVHLRADAATHLADVSARGDFDPATGAGRLDVTAFVRFASAPELGWSTQVTLATERGKRVGKAATARVSTHDLSSNLAELVSAYIHPGTQSDTTIEVPGVSPWSAERPTRYRVTVELIRPDGGVAEATGLWTGFTRVEVRDREFLVNGQPVMFNGVNRHDHHPDTGKTQSLADLRADIEQMKRHNINALRCAHYPNDHRLLDLCDEYGLYVIDEANVESHARLSSLCDDPRYAPAITERSQRMVLRDRNHPSIVAWSLGNESGHGAAHTAAAAWIRHVDPTRAVQYEGAIQKRFSVNEPGAGEALRHAEPSPIERLTTDVVCPMYTSIAAIVDWARWATRTEMDDRPLILCEYSHAMGNTNGSLAEYWEAFQNEPGLQGGFVWDWKDQGLRTTDDHGREFFAYGGHFGDEPNDANFCINGLVSPDGVAHPGLVELAWCGRPVAVSAADPAKQRYAITNRRWFADTSDLAAEWELVVDGVPVASGPVKVGPIEAGQTKAVRIGFPRRALAGAEVAHLVVRTRATKATSWAEAGHLVAWDAVPVDVTGTPKRPAAAPAGSVATADGQITLRSGELRVAIDQASATIASVRVGRAELLAAAPELSLWRAPVDNDGVAQGWMADVPAVRHRWMDLGLDALRIDAGTVATRTRSGVTTVTIDRTWSCSGGAGTHRSTLSVIGDRIEVAESISLPDEWSDLPRVGIRLAIDGGRDRLRWDGLGPHETYPDRRASGLPGRWEATVAEQYHPYVVPQEQGHHTETLRFALTNRSGTGIEFGSDQPFGFSARHHTDQALTAAVTEAELEAIDAVDVHLDAAMRGVGTGACGPDTLPAYQVGGGRHRFRWTMRAVRAD